LLPSGSKHLCAEYAENGRRGRKEKRVSSRHKFRLLFATLAPIISS
jgi:hypothetical protein